MSKQEIKIITKIVRELTLFFMLYGHHQIGIETNYESDKVTFTVRLNTIDADVLKEVKQKISRERELEIETYGWELVGDIDSKSGLEILGHLIDDLETYEDREHVVLTFIRKNRYKSKKGPRL